jgi:hypothetical protein
VNLEPQPPSLGESVGPTSRLHQLFMDQRHFSPEANVFDLRPCIANTPAQHEF